MREGLERSCLSDYSKGVVTRDLVKDIVKLREKNGIDCSRGPESQSFRHVQRSYDPDPEYERGFYRFENRYRGRPQSHEGRYARF